MNKTEIPMCLVTAIASIAIVSVYLELIKTVISWNHSKSIIVQQRFRGFHIP